jgi:hypothetical protein
MSKARPPRWTRASQIPGSRFAKDAGWHWTPDECRLPLKILMIAGNVAPEVALFMVALFSQWSTDFIGLPADAGPGL